MTYHDVALLSSDADFLARTAACYATEELDNPERQNASEWANLHGWDMAAMPGFGDAYGYALLAGTPSPGKDPAVITDEQLLSAVQALLTQPQEASDA